MCFDKFRLITIFKGILHLSPVLSRKSRLHCIFSYCSEVFRTVFKTPNTRTSGHLWGINPKIILLQILLEVMAIHLIRLTGRDFCKCPSHKCCLKFLNIIKQTKKILSQMDFSHIVDIMIFDKNFPSIKT